MGSKVDAKAISKSALRRKRRKEKQTFSNGGDDEVTDGKIAVLEDASHIKIIQEESAIGALLVD